MLRNAISAPRRPGGSKNWLPAAASISIRCGAHADTRNGKELHTVIEGAYRPSRTYLAINLDATQNAFADAGDLLIDITGVTGTIATSNFI